jgi:Right handed beta helix region
LKTQFQRFLLLLATFCSVLTSLTCISRNNPWDPLNGCSDVTKAEYRNDVEKTIGSSIARIQNGIKKFDQYLDDFKIGSQSADSLLRVNNSIRATLSLVALHNDSLRMNNSLLACSLTRILDTFRLLDTLKPCLPDSLTEFAETFMLDSLLVVSEIETGNNRCLPSGIFTARQRESLYLPLVEFSRREDSLNRIQNNYLEKFEDINMSIEKTNDSLSLLNGEIRKYNDSIMASKWFCKKNAVINIDTLKKRPSTLKPGDTLFIGPATFTNGDFKFANRGDSLKPIVVMGSPYMNTVFDRMSFVLSVSKNIIFENLIIQNAKDSSGVRIEGFCESITFRNCVIRNNSKCGIEASVSYLDLINCQIYGNKQDGIYIEKGQTAIPRLIGSNLLIVQNGRYGIYSLNTGVKIEKTTIADNEGGGVNLNDPEEETYLSFVNVCYNKNFGIYKTRTQKPRGTVYFSGCNFYENSNRNIEVESKYIESKETPLFEEPLFVDRDGMNYRMAPASTIYNLSIGYQYGN